MEFTPKNSTTARKPGNDMKKNAGLPKMGSSPAYDQRDKGLGFNGQDNTAKKPSNNGRYAGNQHSGFSNPDMIQMRQQPVTKGYHSDLSGRRSAPATAGAAKNPVESGKRAWTPSAGQNYKGNPDKIQDRQMYNRTGNKD